MPLTLATFLSSARDFFDGHTPGAPAPLPSARFDTLDITLLNVLEDDPEEGTAEVVSVDDGIAYVTNGENDRIDSFDVVSGAKLGEIDLSGLPGYGGVQSVAAMNGLIAAAIEADPEEDNGFVAIFDAGGTLLNIVEVGNLPDMVTFTPDGQKLLVANEGEPLDSIDPLGGVSIIDLSGGVATATAVTLDFTAFDGTEDQLRADGIQIEPGNSASEDLEPEYITVSPDGQTAFVSLQEANAYATVDLTTMQITGLDSFGTIDRSLPGNEIDASNEDGAINLQNYDNLFGLRQPDAITTVEIGGTVYLLSANEGDARDDTEDRVRDLDLDPTAFPDADALQEDEVLGRLNVRTDIGDTDGDGDYDQLFHYGSRSFTIYDTDTGDLVFDSASGFSRLIAEIRPDQFNQSSSFDGRSDDKGVEPEAIAAGQVGENFYAFIGFERDNGVMVVDITNPASPEFVEYIDSEAIGNVGPETIQFIAAEDSATGHAQIAVAYEVSGTTAIYDLTALEAPSLLEQVVDVFNLDEFVFDRGITFDRALDSIEANGFAGSVQRLIDAAEIASLADVVEALDVDVAEVADFVEDLSLADFREIADFFDVTGPELREFLVRNDFFDLI